MSYRSELIQCAAVCLAAIQNLDMGTTKFSPDEDGFGENADIVEGLLAEVRQERARQETKWGPQNRSPENWMVILGEEFGEACKDVLEGELGN